MTNRQVRKLKGDFKKLNIPVFVKNFCEYSSDDGITRFEVTFNKDKLNTEINLITKDKRVGNFNFYFTGKFIDTNCKISLRKNQNYFMLFNRYCKDSYRVKLVWNKDLTYNLINFFSELNLDFDFKDERELERVFEILINNYVIKPRVKYMWNYDITKYNQKIIDKRVKKYEKKIETELYTNNIHWAILKDKVIDDTERLYLLEKYYNKIRYKKKYEINM